MNLVSIVILNWNGKHFLEKFLHKLVDSIQLPGSEIIIADNHSSDDSLHYLKEHYPELRIIQFDRNYGFAEGYNRALEQIDARYYILLNSDIEVPEGWLEPLVDFMEKNHEVAACTPKILDYNRPDYFEYAGAAGGYIDRYGYPFCRGRIFDSIEEDNGQYNQPVEVFWATGACLMIRSERFHELNGFDGKFFAHMEEIDLCWRMKNRGYKICFVPGSKIYHVGGGTLPQGDPFKTYLNFRNNLLLLYKNLPRKGLYRRILTRLLLDGISAFRFLLRGSFSDFIAIMKAHHSFYSLKRSYRKFRQENKRYLNYVTFDTIYPGSIVVDFFLLGKKSFDQLGMNFGQNNYESMI